MFTAPGLPACLGERSASKTSLLVSLQELQAASQLLVAPLQLTRGTGSEDSVQRDARSGNVSSACLLASEGGVRKRP